MWDQASSSGVKEFWDFKKNPTELYNIQKLKGRMLGNRA
jgi:hypothetical protein